MNKGNYFLGFLVLLLLILLIPLDNNTEYEKGYNYTGPDGRIFNFLFDTIGQKTFHVLNLTYEFQEGSLVNNMVSTIPFEYSPMELENVKMDNVSGLILNADAVLLTSDPYLYYVDNSRINVALLTIIRILDSSTSPYIFEIPTGVGKTYEIEGDDSTVVTCKDSTENVPVIEYRLLNQHVRNKYLRSFYNLFNKEGIYLEGECIVLQYKNPEDSVKLSTKLVYHVLGIM